MIRNKTAFTGLLILSICLSGCASVDSVNSAINQISGGIFSVGSVPADSCPLVLSKGVPLASHKIAQEYHVPVDIDTAAARVKRYYRFISSEEVTQLRNNGTQSGGWTAASVADGAWVCVWVMNMMKPAGGKVGRCQTTDSILSLTPV